MRALCAGVVMALAGWPVQAQGVRITLRAWREPVLLDTLAQEHHLSAPPEKAYQAALRAFADLGIPVGNTDGKRGIIGSERFEHTGPLAGAALSRSFECGDGATGANADAFRLEIAVVAFVKPAADGGTTLGLATIASGRDPAGPMRKPKECASTGSLETKLLARVNKLLATG